MENKVSRENALDELRVFVEENIFEELSDEKLEDQYPQVLKSLMDGSLTLGDTPTYQLREPVKDAKGEETVLEKVQFKSRLTVGDKTRISKGINMKEEGLRYSYALMAEVMNLKSTAYLSKMHKYDVRVCEQLSTLFV